MSFGTLRLHIPASTTSAALLNHRNDSDSFSAFPQKYPEHKLTLEAVKRIWLSYSPVNIHPRSFNPHVSLSHATTEDCRADEENVLCLDLGLTASVQSATASNSNTTDPGPSVDIAALIFAHPPSPGQSTRTGTMGGVERELGELSDDSRGGSIGPESSSQIDSTSGRHLSLDQARSALTDSFFKNLKTRDPRCNWQSREQVFQKYVARLDDRQINELMTIGRDVFDDLSKMGDVKRKLSSTTVAAVCEDDRRVRRRLEKTISPVDVVLPMPRNEAHHGGVKADSPSPHILMVKEGRPHATTIDATFDLSGVLDRDNRAHYSARTESSAIEPPFRIVLCCILKSTVVKITSSGRPPNSSSSYLAEAFAKTDTSWPEGGGLFVSLNYGHPEKAGILTPQNFAESPHQIDITNYALPEENTIHLIHLRDHSSYVFFVLAVPSYFSRSKFESHLIHRGRANLT